MVGGSSPAVGLDPPELYSNNWFLVLLRLQMIDFKIAFRFKICFKGGGQIGSVYTTGETYIFFLLKNCVMFLIHV